MGKSTGLGELHPGISRPTAQYIAIPLTVIFSRSLDQGELLTYWKDAIVTPIHKTGSRQVPSNYRSVSLTSVVVKIMERIVKQIIMKFVETSNLLNRKQRSLRKGLF